MSKVAKNLGRLHKEFVKNILNSLSEGGIDAKFTDYPTQRDEDEIIWPAHVIARRKNGLQGKLFFGFRYDISRKGVLMRIYDNLHGAVEDSFIREVVERSIPDYIGKMKQFSSSIGRQLREDSYLLDNEIYCGSVRPKLTFR